MIAEIPRDDILEYLDHIMGSQLNDLKKAATRAQANFLVAMGCMNTIEFLGGISNELLGKKGKVCHRFRDGVRLLQGEYINPPTCDEEIMWELRNGLTHQYVASIEKAYIRHILVVIDWQAEQAIFRDVDEFTLNVAQLIRDLEMAWGKLRVTIEDDKDKLSRITKLFNSLPILQ